MSQKILVTGGAGYIGSHCVRMLLARGHTVRVLDSLLWGDEALQPMMNGAGNLEVFQGDIRHVEDVVVRKGHEGKGVGGSVVRAALEKARLLGCYKVILDCKADLVDFYKKLGFIEHDVGMRIDLARPAASSSGAKRKDAT